MREIYDDDGTPRFRGNPIVHMLLSAAEEKQIDMNFLGRMHTHHPFPQAAWEEFYQLIGYSLKGYHELSYVSDKSALDASAAAIAAGLEDTGCRSRNCPIHCGIETEIQT